MKIYAIYDKETARNSALGYLFYYEKANEYIIELNDWLDEWEAPILFQGLVKKGIYTVPRDVSLLWVRERVIPSGRQNIGSILKNARLKEYNEMALLALSKGKCSQDSCYIEEISNNIETLFIDESPTNKLNTESKTLIDYYAWKTGAIELSNRTNTPGFYKSERGNVTGKICNGGSP